jgi:hypothetical protein
VDGWERGIDVRDKNNFVSELLIICITGTFASLSNSNVPFESWANLN